MRTVLFAALGLFGLAAPAQAQVVFYSDYSTPRTVYRTAPATRYVEYAPTVRYLETVPATRYVEYAPTTRVVVEPPVTRTVLREFETVPTRTVVVRDVEPLYVVRSVPVETVRVAEPTYVVRSRTVVRPSWRHR